MLNLKVYCLFHGVEAKDLGEEIGVNPRLISNVWNGVQKPSPRLRREISSRLGVSESVLFAPFDISFLNRGEAIIV